MVSVRRVRRNETTEAQEGSGRLGVEGGLHILQVFGRRLRCRRAWPHGNARQRT